MLRSLPRRHALVASLTAVGLVALVLLVPTAFASKATSARPEIVFASTAPAAGATLSPGSHTWNFTYNRTPKQTAAGNPVCSLSGGPASVPAAPCSTTGPTTYNGGSMDSVTYTTPSCMPDADYTLTITLKLTDGGTASTTRAFTAVDPNIGACGT